MTVEEWTVVRLSLQVAVCAVIVSLPPAVWIGYVLARRSFSMKWLVETVVNLPLVLPPVVTGYLLLVTFGRRGPVGSLLEGTLGLRITFTWLGAVLAAGVVSFPLMVRAIRLAFEGIDPRLEAAAGSLGAGRLDAFFTVSLPLALPGVVAGCILAFARSLGEFGATIMLAGNIPGETRTIPLAIFSLVNRPGGIERSWRLVIVAVILAAAAVVASELLQRKEWRREST